MVSIARKQAHGVVREHERQERDRAGLHDGHARPAEHETRRIPERVAQHVVLAAGVRVRTRQLRVAQRAGKRDEPTGDPHGEEAPDVGDVRGDDGWRAEDPGTHDQPDDEHDAVERRQNATRSRDG